MAEARKALSEGWVKAEKQIRTYRDRVTFAREAAGWPRNFDPQKMRASYPNSRCTVLVTRQQRTE
jgi:hypothetical protein